MTVDWPERERDRFCAWQKGNVLWNCYHCCCSIPSIPSRFSNLMLMLTGLSSEPDAQCCQNGAVLSILYSWFDDWPARGRAEPFCITSSPNPNLPIILFPTEVGSIFFCFHGNFPQFQHCSVESLVRYLTTRSTSLQGGWRHHAIEVVLVYGGQQPHSTLALLHLALRVWPLAMEACSCRHTFASV